MSKDQSYVLFGVPQEELGRMLLPIGEMEKSAVGTQWHRESRVKSVQRGEAVA